MRNKLSRREAMATLGTVSLGSILAACGEDGGPTRAARTERGASTTVQSKTATSKASAELFEGAATCAVTPELTEGPYYLDVDSIRSDIREDREGTSLRLAVRVRDAGSCEPIENAVVEIWHCDALGLYSGFESASTGDGGPPGGGPPGDGPRGDGPPGGARGSQGGGGGREPTDEKTYLRGVQVTNADGIVEFTTIYPGWYRGRTVHIHAKVHLDRKTVLTTQLFFDEEVTSAVFKADPYGEDTGRDTFNDSDGIFEEELILTSSKEGDGYLGVMTFDVRRG